MAFISQFLEFVVVPCTWYQHSWQFRCTPLVSRYCIRTETHYTNTFTIETGVQQGCILSALLFFMVINILFLNLSTMETPNVMLPPRLWRPWVSFKDSNPSGLLKQHLHTTGNRRNRNVEDIRSHEDHMKVQCILATIPLVDTVNITTRSHHWQWDTLPIWWPSTQWHCCWAPLANRTPCLPIILIREYENQHSMDATPWSVRGNKNDQKWLGTVHPLMYSNP